MPSKAQKAGAAAAICAAAAAVCLPLTQQSEGLRNKPYLDPAHILTVCYGETEGVEARIYSTDECAGKLRHRLANDYAPRIAECLPEIATNERIKVFGALLDAAYNAGPVAVCNSRMASAIRLGNVVDGCALLDGWYVTARNRKTGVRVKLPGLVKRRRAEAALCLEGAA